MPKVKTKRAAAKRFKKTGSGKIMDSRMIGCASSQSVSPVVVNFRPTAAAISPEKTSSISCRLFACI
ncbi:MAG: 50S ribosomal protein L35 [Lachnospiraceae bacterium]|nr:50S ribosomal protein L35 [Lachnospiraceae bacterium]